MGRTGVIAVPDNFDLFSVLLAEKLTSGGGDGGSNTLLSQLISRTITSITIPEDVTTIGTSAFNQCTALTSVTLHDKITRIEQNAFIVCKSLEAIELPNSVTYIGSAAFRQCHSLTSVTLPESLTTISPSLFYECKNLTDVTIPNSITEIQIDAFNKCSALTTIHIPSSVTTISNTAFSGCTSLETIYVDKPTGSISGAPWGAPNATVVWHDPVIEIVSQPTTPVTAYFGEDFTATVVVEAPADAELEYQWYWVYDPEDTPEPMEGETSASITTSLLEIASNPDYGILIDEDDNIVSTMYCVVSDANSAYASVTSDSVSFIQRDATITITSQTPSTDAPITAHVNDEVTLSCTWSSTWDDDGFLEASWLKSTDNWATYSVITSTGTNPYTITVTESIQVKAVIYTLGEANIGTETEPWTITVE